MSTDPQAARLGYLIRSAADDTGVPLTAPMCNQLAAAMAAVCEREGITVVFVSVFESAMKRAKGEAR